VAELQFPDGTYVGSIVLFVKGHDTAELAYVVAPEARGRGLARGAVTLLGNWAVANLGIHASSSPSRRRTLPPSASPRRAATARRASCVTRSPFAAAART
jgi:hypothetical protein